MGSRRTAATGAAFVLVATCVSNLLTSQTCLAAVAAGDIAIIGYRADDPDALAFVVLEAVAAGEVIRFTDSGWQTSGSFRATEGGMQFTVPSTLPAGTVVTRSNPFTSGDWSTNAEGVGSNGFALSTSGDQILAFQGSGASPSFVYAVNADSTGWSNATSSNTTALPTGLVDGTTAVSLDSPERDNVFYNGPTTGTPEALRTAIGDPANWTGSDSPQTWPSWSFNVTSSGNPAIIDVWLSASAFDLNDPATVTVELEAAPPSGSPATVSVASGGFSSSPVQIVISYPNATGNASVTMGNAGSWTAAATPVSGCTGSAESDSFSVGAGPQPPTAYAGSNRTVVLSGSAVYELMSDATGNDPNGLTGLTYEWTPAGGTGILGWTDRTGAIAASTDPSDAQVTINQTGIYDFTLIVTDPDLLFDTDTVRITVVDSAPAPDYEPPVDYYDPARPGGVWYTGATLKTALHDIISAHVVRSYDSARTALQLLDEDPNNSSNLILLYTGQSVPKPWDSGVTWNREHMWPDSRNPGGAVDSDLHHLRPVNPSVNSARGNSPYGTGTGYWDADQGAPHRGEAARAMFYLCTAYSDLSLVVGLPSGYEMGDLTALLEWHYEDPVDLQERRRNHLIYSNLDNPAYFQANRNPFVDHPELVWTIWGGGSNQSRLYVGTTAPPDGTSYDVVDFGTLIVGATLPAAQAVTLHKIGTDPTTYDILISGDAAADPTGPRQAFVAGTQSRSVDVWLATSTATAGDRSGLVVIDNTELSSAGSGYGAADGDDVIELLAEVLDHSEASFENLADVNTLTIDFGTQTAGGGIQSTAFDVWNLESTPGFTAALDVDGTVPTGDLGVVFSDISGPTSVPAGQAASFTAYFNTNQPAGSYETTYTVAVSDENLSGAIAGTNLLLTLTGQISAAPIFPFDDDGDGDVDLLDFEEFFDCMNGPGETAVAPCDNHDADLDGDVDLDDAARFSAVFTG